MMVKFSVEVQSINFIAPRLHPSSIEESIRNNIDDTSYLSGAIDRKCNPEKHLSFGKTAES